MGAVGEAERRGVSEAADLTPPTLGLFAQRSSLCRACSLIRISVLMSRAAPAAAVAPELPRPGQKLVLIEAQVLPELDVRHLVGSGALIEPTHLDSEEAGRLLNGQPRHPIPPVETTPKTSVGLSIAR